MDIVDNPLRFRRLGLSAAALVAFFGLAGPPPAVACSFVTPSEHYVFMTQQAVDTTPPAAVSGVAVSIHRGRGTGSACSATSCDGIATLTLTFPTPLDDRSGADRIGYRIEVLDGALPDGLVLPEGPISMPSVGGETELTFVWGDGEPGSHERFAFSIAIYTLDSAGNESAASEPIHIGDAGDEGPGCQVSLVRPSGAHALLFGAVLVVLLVLRRRRAA